MNKIEHTARTVLHYSRKAKQKIVKSNKEYIFNLDNPKRENQDKQTVTVSGWIVSKDNLKVKGVRLKNGGHSVDIPFGLKRADVAKAFPRYEFADISGFSGDVTFEDGSFSIEVDLGKGYKQVYISQIKFTPEKLVSSLYNPNLAQNYAEHQNLISNKYDYYHEGINDTDFRRHSNDPRLLAFYLPQFHPIEQNDLVWGKNFTEWTNVTAATPRFVGHQQPNLPSDLGFYDLRMEEKIKEQIDLAKKTGLYGFCFYYYWFSGKKILNTPLNSFLKHKDWDFNFTICWANENWTRRWDGRDDDIIIAQEYNEDDPLRFIKDVGHILIDKRYIQEDGKPALIVYRASELKDPAAYAKVWREYFRKKYHKELHLVSVMGFDVSDPRSYGFDASVEFSPQTLFFKNSTFPDNKFPYVNVGRKLLDINFEGQVADYRELALNTKQYGLYDFPTYQCVTPAWDNDARRKGSGFVLTNNNPDLYTRWLSNMLEHETTKKSTSPIVFVNAWNEWAEGAVLEPTQQYGHAILNRTKETLAKYSSDANNRKNLPQYGLKRRDNVKLAVVIHLYYPEKWKAIKSRLEFIEEPHDLFITLNKKDAEFAQEIKRYDNNANITIVPNRGRDVLPFLYIMRRLDDLGYEHVLKLHTKKSKHRSDGDKWFNEVVDSLLPSQEMVAEAIRLLESGKAAIIGPRGHLVSLKRHMGSNEEHLKYLLSRIYGKNRAAVIIRDKDQFGYFGGTMFWASVESLRPTTDLFLLPDDFEPEAGQIDGTLAHAVERLLSIVPQCNNEDLYDISIDGIDKSVFEPKKYKYAP